MKKYLGLFLVAMSIVLSANVAFAIGDDWQEKCTQMMSGGNWGNYGMMDGANRFGGGYGMMNNDWGNMGFWSVISMILSIALWVIFWAITIVVIVALVRWLYLKVFKGELWIFGHKETAVDALKMRYAKGDIAKHEYEEMMKELMK